MKSGSDFPEASLQLAQRAGHVQPRSVLEQQRISSGTGRLNLANPCQVHDHRTADAHETGRREPSLHGRDGFAEDMLLLPRMEDDIITGRFDMVDLFGFEE